MNKNKFIWITPNYRVNIDSIFSMERRESDKPSQEYKEWLNKYEEFLTGINNDNSKFLEYIKGYDNVNHLSTEDIIKEYAILNIGNPPELEYTYWLILCTGITVKLGKDKFEAINRIIDNIYENNTPVKNSQKSINKEPVNMVRYVEG